MTNYSNMRMGYAIFQFNSLHFIQMSVNSANIWTGWQDVRDLENNCCRNGLIINHNN